jgi:hypothetical protein
VNCEAGRGPTLTRDDCEPCVGKSEACSPPDGEMIENCTLNDDRSACDDAAGSNCRYTPSELDFSPSGSCLPCDFPNVVSCLDDEAGTLQSGFQMTCEEGLNAFGTDCDFDLEEVGMPKGTTLGMLCPASCERCGDGERFLCVTCPPGKQPNAERNGCTACTSVTYSQFGIICMECPGGQTPNADTSATGCVDINECLQAPCDPLAETPCRNDNPVRCSFVLACLGCVSA